MRTAADVGHPEDPPPRVSRTRLSVRARGE